MPSTNSTEAQVQTDSHKQVVLPSFAEAIAQFSSSSERLPAYRSLSRLRYHPYARFPVTPEAEAERSLLNTVYDDEYIILNVPPLEAAFPDIPADLPADVRHALAQIMADRERMQRLSSVMGIFIAGVRNAVINTVNIISG